MTKIKKNQKKSKNENAIGSKLPKTYDAVIAAELSEILNKKVSSQMVERVRLGITSTGYIQIALEKKYAAYVEQLEQLNQDTTSNN